MSRKKEHKRHGFTLLEILLAMAIMGIIAVFAIALSSSVQHAAKTSDTQLRMKEIVAKAKAHYRNSEALPAGVGTSGTDVPVGATDLNMEQKYRYDAWGAPLRYYRQPLSVNVVEIPPTPPPIAATLTILDIDYYTVDGKPSAGVIVSDGPNQTADSTPDGSGNITTTGDDIVIPIDVTQEAVEIALDELKVLQEKVKALDGIYEGVDNDGDGSIDEGGFPPPPIVPPCQVAKPQSTGLGCPPTIGMLNDPNCGTASLDEIEDNVGGQNYDCSIYTVATIQSDALGNIVGIYSLGLTYMVDPWGNAYQWGCNTTYASGCANDYPSSDPHYHKFFSMGPDLTAGGGDDIIP